MNLDANFLNFQWKYLHQGFKIHLHVPFEASNLTLNRERRFERLSGGCQMNSHLSQPALMVDLGCFTVPLGSSVSFDWPPSDQASPASRMGRQHDFHLCSKQSRFRLWASSWYPNLLGTAHWLGGHYVKREKSDQQGLLPAILREPFDSFVFIRQS